jgi:hypothetical protein
MCRLLPDPDATCDAHDRTDVTGAGVFERRQLGSSESRRGVSRRESGNTAIKLREAGFDAKYMNGGHSGWKALGHPLRLNA